MFQRGRRTGQKLSGIHKAVREQGSFRLRLSAVGLEEGHVQIRSKPEAMRQVGESHCLEVGNKPDGHIQR